MLRKIFVVGGGRGYMNWMQGRQVGRMKEADLVVFTGGEDVNPEVYGKKAHPLTGFNRVRDRYEMIAFEEAQERNKKIIGICRGSQLMCALAGGILVQHQQHPWIHPILTENGRRIFTTSTHHQRQFPWGGKKPRFKLLAWATPRFSPFSQGEGFGDDMADRKPEAEVVLYPDIKALAIQGHPEMVYPAGNVWEQNFIGFCREQLNNLMES